MKIVAALVAFSAFALCALPADAQLLKTRGDPVEIRVGPGVAHPVRATLNGEDSVLQLRRVDDWIETNQGWVPAASVEWVYPLKQRGGPAVSVAPHLSMDSRVNKHAVSPSGQLIALSKLGDEREVLIFKTADQKFITRLDAGDFGGQAGGYTELGFLDENTLLLQVTDRRSGIGEPQFPYEELVFDIPSGTVLHRGRALFGYLGRNPHDQDGRIISFASDFIRLHDPQSLETVGVTTACGGQDTPCRQVEIKLFDVSFDNERKEISAVAKVREKSDPDSTFHLGKEYYLVARGASLQDLGRNLSNLEGIRIAVEPDGETSTYFFSQIPSKDILLTFRMPKKKSKPVEIWDLRTQKSIGTLYFTGIAEKQIAICKDERDIFGWSEAETDGAEEGEKNLTSITLNSDRSLEFKPMGASLAPRHISGAIVCLDPGRRASVRERIHVFSLGDESPPADHQIDSRYSSFTFDLVIEGGPLHGLASNPTRPRIDLDRLADRESLTEELGFSDPPGGESFINSAGEMVIVRSNEPGPILIVDKDSKARPISDPAARQVFMVTVHSHDRSKMLLMSSQGKLSILDTRSGELVAIREMKKLEAYNENYGKDRYLRDTWRGESTAHGSTFAFSADGALLHVLDRDTSSIEVIDTATGLKVREYPSEVDYCRGESTSTMLPDGKFACLTGSSVEIMNFQTGTRMKSIPLSSWLQVRGLALDQKGKLLFQRVGEGMLINDVATGREVARLYMEQSRRTRNDEKAPPPRWLLITPEGFYTGNAGADELLQANLGTEQVYGIDKFRDALYRPDLVAEALKGDPERLVATAASEISLEKILHSGAAPQIIIKGELAGDRVLAAADITDMGGGIGRLEWRVNGVVQKAADGGPSASAELYLAEGENTVQVVAYNEANTIQARSNAMTFSVAASDVHPPRLFIMAVGVNDYALDRLKLEYAVRDAETVAGALAKAGSGLYTEVHTEIVLDAEVTRAGLEQRFDALAQRIRPNDVFVFFSAGHGKTIDGRFFYAPQDIDGTTVAAVRAQGIGHSTWQEWFSRIPAQKSLLLFDSCESGALTESSTGRELRFRAANDLLGNSTGRALIAASSSTEYAMEGYEGHGVFTYSILDALTWADVNGDGVIEIDELADAIEQTVPRIARDVFGETQTPQYMRPLRSFDIVEQVSQL